MATRSDLPWRWKRVNRSTCNRVALSFLPNMRGSRGVDSVLDVALAFLQAGDQDGVRLLFAFWVVEGRLNIVEQRELNQRLREHEMPEIMDWLREEGIEIGIRATELENARKMLAEGFGWDVITRITGIKPEDLI